jgi:hypothetical protein
MKRIATTVMAFAFLTTGGMLFGQQTPSSPTQPNQTQSPQQTQPMNQQDQQQQNPDSTTGKTHKKHKRSKKNKNQNQNNKTTPQGSTSTPQRYGRQHAIMVARTLVSAVPRLVSALCLSREHSSRRVSTLQAESPRHEKSTVSRVLVTEHSFPVYVLTKDSIENCQIRASA